MKDRIGEFMKNKVSKYLITHQEMETVNFLHWHIHLHHLDSITLKKPSDKQSLITYGKMIS